MIPFCVGHNVSPADENPGSFDFIVHSLYNTVECFFVDFFWGGGVGGKQWWGRVYFESLHSSVRVSR